MPLEGLLAYGIAVRARFGGRIILVPISSMKGVISRFLNEDDGLQMAFLDGNQPDRLCNSFNQP